MEKSTNKGKMSTELPVQVPESGPGAYDVDYEKYGAQREANPLPELKRKLKSRHLQMIAIGESEMDAAQECQVNLSKVVQSEPVCSSVAGQPLPTVVPWVLSSRICLSDPSCIP